MSKLVNFMGVSAILASMVTLSEPDLSHQVKDTECDCLMQRDHQIQKQYGPDSFEAAMFLDHIIYTCKVPTVKEYSYCSGNIEVTQEHLRK